MSWTCLTLAICPQKRARVATHVGNQSQGSIMESSPVSSYMYGTSDKRRSSEYSHLHIGVPETVPLRRSESFSRKLQLAQWADVGGTNLCTLSPYNLRLSGAGFVYNAPGPETSV
ncbi:hypothetical protein UPYG_G00306960 [Umbra pygmaea]|uniref:Uncharacterized protein n=1 Tax=Umbra pygmaea TaxID=75934 RepID=A0ABD0VYS8_UMBPY